MSGTGVCDVGNDKHVAQGSLLQKANSFQKHLRGEKEKRKNSF